VLQRLADRADAAVHHVAGREDVGAGRGMGQRLPHQRLDGGVIEDVAVRIDQPVLAVGGVGVQGLVGHHSQLGEARFQRADRTRHDPVLVPGDAAVGGLGRRVRHAEQVQHRHPQFQRLLAHPQQLVDRQPFHPRH